MKYAIYAVGDALIDIEFEVSDQQLQSFKKVNKGETSLLEEKDLCELQKSLTTPPKIRTSGGSISNTVITAQLLGGNNFFCGIVADDDDGECIFQDLCERRIDNNLAKPNRKPGITGKCIVLLTPDGERSLLTYKGICTELAPQQLDSTLIKAAEFIYTEGFLVTCPETFLTSKAAHQLAKKFGKKRVLGLSDPNIVHMFRQNFLELVEDPVDILFCNEKEAQLFCQTDDLEKIKKILPQYAKNFIITQDARGSMVFDGNTFYQAQANPVKVQNSLGAGDAFAGAFLYALNQGHTCQAANHLANLVASRVVTQYGPRIDAQDAVEVLTEWKNLLNHL